MENPTQMCHCGRNPVNEDNFIGGSYFCEECWTIQINIITKTPSIDKIVDNLYLGNVDAASTRHVLTERKINHILVAGSYLSVAFPDDYVYKILAMKDFPGQDIKQYFDEAIRFIHAAIKEGNPVLVHCYAGISRSATIVIAYMMATNSWTLDQAFKYVQSKRSVVCPNHGFREQLKKFEEELQNRPFRFETD